MVLVGKFIKIHFVAYEISNTTDTNKKYREIFLQKSHFILNNAKVFCKSCSNRHLTRTTGKDNALICMQRLLSNFKMIKLDINSKCLTFLVITSIILYIHIHIVYVGKILVCNKAWFSEWNPYQHEIMEISLTLNSIIVIAPKNILPNNFGRRCRVDSVQYKSRIVVPVIWIRF